MNLSALARELGISRPTLNKYKAEGLPLDNLDAAREFVAKRKASDGRGGRRAPVAGNLLTLREQVLQATVDKTRAEARLKQYEVEQAQKTLVPKADAKQYLAEILGPLRQLLDALPQTAGPRANPVDPVCGETAIREALDAIFRQMQKAEEAARDVG